MIFRRTFEIGRARGEELLAVARLAVELHELEGGDETDVAADHDRALRHLEHLHDTGGGVCFVARQGARVVGCIVLEFEPLVSGPALASAGGLVCTGSAPRGAALALMYHAACHLWNGGYRSVWLMAATEKNRKRRTYAAMGFAPIREREGRQYMRADLGDVLEALEKRLGV